ncbi:hypothetical protein QQ045_015782 [Rhodiola kirilowii]
MSPTRQGIVWRKNGPNTHPNPILAIAIKLKALRRRLKGWNWNTFGNITLKIKALATKVDLLEHDMQTNCTRRMEIELIKAKDELSRSQRQQFQMLTDKANAHWVAEGDRNTTLFHAMIKARRSKNSIKLDMPDGSSTSDRKIIGPLALEFFSNILGSYSTYPSTDAFTTVNPIITEQDNLSITATPDEVEVCQVINSLNPSSAPGPDGFTGHFYKHCWHIIKEDILLDVRGFFQDLPLAGAITATNLVLIPKKPNATRIDQLRPISLCNFIHKILSGILNSRLALILPRIIS